MRTLLLLLLVLPGMTGCDPCRDLDARFEAPALREIPEGAPTQLEIQVSLPALSVRLDQAFRDGASVRPGEANGVRWSGLALDRSEGLTAVVAVHVASGGDERPGTVRIPVRPEAVPKGPGVAVRLAPDGDPVVRVEGLDEAARAALQSTIAARSDDWLEAPALDVLGWFRADGFLPLSVVDVSAGKGVLILRLATGIEARPLTNEDRDRRPGMADDVTISASLSLLTGLESGGWLPIPPRGTSGATEKPPTWPVPPPGWQVRVEEPDKGARDLRVPFIARRTDQCSFVAVDAEVAPGIAAGFLGWHPPQRLTVTEGRGDREVPEHVVDDLTRAALAGLAAPMSPPPVLGPGSLTGIRGPLRLVRTGSGAMMFDGLLVPAVRRPQRGQPRGGAAPGPGR